MAAGDLLALLAALGFAVWTLAVGIFVMRYRRPVLMVAVQLALCGVLCIGFGAGLNGLPSSQALMAALPEILIVGLVSKGFAYVMMAIAQQHISATAAGILVSAEAVFGALIATIILGETLDLSRGFGCFCIILGVYIAARIPVQLSKDLTSTMPVVD